MWLTLQPSSFIKSFDESINKLYPIRSAVETGWTQAVAQLVSDLHDMKTMAGKRVATFISAQSAYFLCNYFTKNQNFYDIYYASKISQ